VKDRRNRETQHFIVLRTDNDRNDTERTHQKSLKLTLLHFFNHLNFEVK